MRHEVDDKGGCTRASSCDRDAISSCKTLSGREAKLLTRKAGKWIGPECRDEIYGGTARARVSRLFKLFLASYVVMLCRLREE